MGLFQSFDISASGMTAERFLWAVIKSQVLYPKKLAFHSTNLMQELSKGGRKHA